jgi:hypothetical protein
MEQQRVRMHLFDIPEFPQSCVGLIHRPFDPVQQAIDQRFI